MRSTTSILAVAAILTVSVGSACALSSVLVRAANTPLPACAPTSESLTERPLAVALRANICIDAYEYRPTEHGTAWDADVFRDDWAALGVVTPERPTN